MKYPKRYELAELNKVEPEVAEELRSIGASKKSAYLFGGVGVGKTYAVYAFARFIGEGNIQVVNVPDLLSSVRADFNRPEFERVRLEASVEDFDRYVVFDDIGAEKPSDWVAETLYCLINRRYEEQLPTIFTSNCTVGELSARLGDRLASRTAEMCEVIELKGQDKRLL